MTKNKVITNLASLILDYALVVSAFVSAYYLREQLNNAYLVSFQEFFIFALLAGLIYVLIFSYLEMYAIERSKGLLDQLFTLMIGSFSATTIAGAIIYFAKSFDYSRLIVGTALFLAIVFVWLGRFFFREIELYFYRRGIGVSHILLIGTIEEEGRNGSWLLKSVVNGYKSLGLEGAKLIGMVLTGNGKTVVEFEGIPILGRISGQTQNKAQISRLIKAHQINEIVLANPHLSENSILEIINLCEASGVRFKFVPGLFDVAIANTVVADLAGLPIIELRPTLLDGWMVIGKRMMDICLASLASVVLAPVFLVIAIAIKIDSQGPVFFKHRRVGQSGQEFEVIKFRSMAMIEKDGQLLHSSANLEIEKLKEQNTNYKLEHDPRITRVGHFIRKTSIDELPQFWNVLKGEMSLVGPRPYLAKELDKQQRAYPHTRALVQRLQIVRPGITGPWQVSGRSEIAFTERVAMDAYYATHANIWMDIKILLKTIPVVVRGSGAM